MPQHPHNSLSPETDYFILSTVYDAKTNGAGIKLYDVENKKVIYTTDTYDHEPYCFSCEPLEKIQAIDFPPNTVKRIETIVKKNLLNESEDPLVKIITPTPSEVPKVRDIVGETWESRIKYHRNWIYDIQIVPGRRYWWDSNQKKFIPSRSISSGLKIPKSVTDQLTQYSDLLEVFRDDFIQEIPDMPIVACDIETDSEEGQIPQAADPKFQIICICFADNQRKEIALVLNRENRKKGIKPKDISPNLQIERFEAEEDLLKRSFEILQQYTIITTFNGDNFDFPYLHERAKKLAKDRKIGIYSPVKWNRRDKSCDFKFGLHLDLYRFYHNVAIRTYAFGNRYQEETLEAIAQALLGEGKVELEKEIFELSEWDLIHYCSRDAKLTLDLLLFENQTPLNLIFILSRISRTPLDNLVRTSVSNWVRSLFFFEHRRRGYLIPNPEDIQIAKGTQASSKAIIKGKKYKGATVIDPIPGIHFNVAVLDFACLDEDTEIMTYDGWRSREEIHENDLILTLNIETNNLEYNKVQKKYDYDYNGKMYHIDTKSTEQLVTPNHRVIYFERDRSNQVRDKMRWKETASVSEAKNMNGYWYSIPYTGNWKKEKRERLEANGISLDMDSFLALYGIFLSDGAIHSNGRAVQIFQSKEPELSQIREIIETFCHKNGYRFTENEYKSEQGSKYTILAINNKKLAQFFSSLLNDVPNKQRSRFITREFLMLNREQLKILWDGLMLGDGGKGKYKDKDCYRNYSGVSKRLAEDVQELSIKLGIGAILLRERRNPKAFGKVYENHVSYRVSFSYERKNVVSKQNNPIHSHPYSGKVWCVSTRNGTIMTRRNGKVSITGNSLYPSIISTFNLSYETLLCNHKECKKNKVPQTSYWVCEQNRGIVADVIGFIKDVRVQWLKPESKKGSPQKEFYQILERSLKVLINASYGVLGSDRFQFYCLPVADATTAYGRDAIEKAIQKSQALGISVLYGDTDSLFLQNPTKEQIDEIIQWSREELGVGLEMEKIYRYLVLSERKKNYFGVYPDSSVEVKGLMGKKRNTPPFLQKGFREVLAILAKVTTKEEFDEAKKQVINLIRSIYQKLEKREYSAADLAITTQLTQPLHRYKVQAQHVKAAAQLNDYYKQKYKDEKNFVKAGQLIRFVKTRTSDRVTPLILMTKPSKIDVKAYKSMVDSTFDQLFGALDIEVEEIATGQVNLMEFFG